MQRMGVRKAASIRTNRLRLHVIFVDEDLDLDSYDICDETGELRILPCLRQVELVRRIVDQVEAEVLFLPVCETLQCFDDTLGNRETGEVVGERGVGSEAGVYVQSSFLGFRVRGFEIGFDLEAFGVVADNRDFVRRGKGHGESFRILAGLIPTRLTKLARNGTRGFCTE